MSKTFTNRNFSPKEVGLAIGSSESSLKRWINSGELHATKTAGGHRRIALAEAIRFIRESKAEIVRPDVLGFADLGNALSEVGDVGHHGLLREALVHGRASEARGIVASLYIAGRSVAEICDGPIREAMTEIGDMWRHSDRGIAIEHRATDICVDALNQIRAMVPLPADGAPVAIGGAPEHDPYALPSLMAATVLCEVGYAAINLGGNTPTQVLVDASKHDHARLVWLATTSSIKSIELNRAVSQLCDAGADRHSVAVGGQQAKRYTAGTRANLLVANSMSELAAFARGLVAIDVD